jgi:hypothetical protein
MPEEYAYPIEANKDFVRSDDIERYVEFLFGGVDWQPHQILGLRGIGEKRTPKEGKFQNDEFLQPYHGDPTNRIVSISERWAMYHIATFVVPCVLKSACGAADQVELFTVILADLDSGDTDAKIGYMAEHCGIPSMVVASGGTTETGHTKRHVYYRLASPTYDIRKVVELRDQLWRKCGGDSTMGLGVEGNPYGRAHQPVRIAGTCHAKSGHARSCVIEHQSGNIFELDEIAAKIEAMPAGPWLPPEIAEKRVLEAPGAQGGGLFTPVSGRAPVDLMTPVEEGGEVRTRWGVFSQAAGHYIHCVRRGEIDTTKALELVKGWVNTTMHPPWDEHRVEKEFRAILDKDIQTEGPMPTTRTPLVPPDAPDGLQVWAAHRWVTEPKPKHEFLVDKLIIRGEPHLFPAEGGGGKTGLLADLAMKIAAHREGDTREWCGKAVLTGGTVVLVLCEDSKTEMHIRLMDLDKDGLISAAGDRLIVLPMTAAELGGAFPLVSRGPDGVTTSSPRWNEMIQLLGKLPDLKAVIIDTFNATMHGDENSSQTIAEMMREANRVTGQLGAALIYTHHVRKANGEPIRSLEDLRDGIRGSTAILSSFRVNFGMYRPPDYRRRLEAMKEPSDNPTRLWIFGICKANIHGLMEGTRTLMRDDVGVLRDVTALDLFANVDKRERLAWLIYAVEMATIHGHPYKQGRGFDGLYTRRSELPTMLRHMGEFELKALVESGLQNGQLMMTTAPSGKSKSWLDVSGGLLSKDSFEAVIKPGAYNDVPVWDNYAFNPAAGVIQDRKNLLKPGF